MSATVEQLEALPEGAVVRSGTAGRWTWIKDGDGWGCYELQISKYSGELWDTERGNDGLQILWPQPEPDHSMCARLVHVVNDMWTYEHPNGERVNDLLMSRHRLLELGYGVPPYTVRERAVIALGELDLYTTNHEDLVAHLDKLGLLAKDGDS